jgi:hypothetical protein
MFAWPVGAPDRPWRPAAKNSLSMFAKASVSAGRNLDLFNQSLGTGRFHFPTQAGRPTAAALISPHGLHARLDNVRQWPLLGLLWPHVSIGRIWGSGAARHGSNGRFFTIVRPSVSSFYVADRGQFWRQARSHGKKSGWLHDSCRIYSI